MDTAIATYHPSIGEHAPELTVLRAGSAEEFPLSRLWKSGPALLVFLRHTGCMFCKEHADQLCKDREKFTEAGCTVGLISVSSAADMEQFCAKHQLEECFVCLSDASRRAYRAYGLSQGTASELVNRKVLARGLRATLHGYLNGLPKGDPLQLPGLFLVDRNGIIRFEHRGQDAADNPANEVIFAALDQLS